ncbi:MAG: TIGR00282 family metallophosphoesterase [Candidatus Cloacimonetes bacterium]|nr:TIGR00282 family metallophosphoesterase [Candidatus Cloacimonadota bacterium]
MNILYIGDIFGKPGRKTVQGLLPGLREEFGLDLVIANGENLAGGLGMTPDTAKAMFESGVDVLTSGNHLWDKKEIIAYLEQEKRVVKPINYPPAVPGNDVFEIEVQGKRVVILCLMGRVFTVTVDCPFRVMDTYLERLTRDDQIIIVDFHAEATAEKQAMAWYLDGRITALIGSHTHVQTADERILPQGTAYITDAGMTGPQDSIIGLRREDGIERFLTQIPNRFNPAKENLMLNGVFISIDEDGTVASIKRIQRKYQVD